MPPVDHEPVRRSNARHGSDEHGRPCPGQDPACAPEPGDDPVRNRLSCTRTHGYRTHRPVGWHLRPAASRHPGVPKVGRATHGRPGDRCCPRPAPRAGAWRACPGVRSAGQPGPQATHQRCSRSPGVGRGAVVSPVGRKQYRMGMAARARRHPRPAPAGPPVAALRSACPLAVEPRRATRWRGARSRASPHGRPPVRTRSFDAPPLRRTSSRRYRRRVNGRAGSSVQTAMAVSTHWAWASAESTRPAEHRTSAEVPMARGGLGWADQVVWWHAYPLGIVGAEKTLERGRGRRAPAAAAGGLARPPDLAGRQRVAARAGVRLGNPRLRHRRLPPDRPPAR